MVVETEIIDTAFEVNKREEETFEVDAENLTQMNFLGDKIVAESSEITKFQNNANEEVDIEIYTPGHTSMGGRKLKERRWASRRWEVKMTIGKSGNKRKKSRPRSTVAPIFPPLPSSLNAAAFQRGVISALMTPKPPTTPLSALKEAEMESQ